MNKKKARFLKLFVATLIILGVVGTIFSLVIKTNTYFVQKSLDIKDSRLFDIGIVDANEDGILDVFTSNHNARQSLLVGDKTGKFIDVLSQWGLDQNRDFPGSEESDTAPLMDKPGLYIYRQLGEILNIRTYQIDQINNTGSLTGRFSLSSPVKIKHKHLVDSDIKESELESGTTQTTVKFATQNNSWLSLETYLASLSHFFKLDERFPLDRVYIGSNRVHPDSHEFVLSWRDRHGQAWADYNQDDRIDVFMVRGGMRAMIKQISKSEIVRDELLSNQGIDKFKDDTANLGIIKQDCRGYKPAWIDFNNNNKLDLYIGCRQTSNQLYKQQNNGQFVNVADELGLNLHDGEIFAWLDYDNDGDMDLLSAEEKILKLYVNQSGYFESLKIIPNLKAKLQKFTISDYDLDGDLDAYVVFKDQNILLINNGETFMPKEPALVGLPTKGLTADWVDFDNDGLMDLHVVPTGLYRQLPNHKFQKTELLNNKFSLSNFLDARCAWFDYDNDGARDLLVAVQKIPLEKRIFNRLFKPESNYSLKWQSRLYRNISSEKNHWLELNLIGSEGNRQAIGAKVKVVTPDGTQLQQVGQSEGSHYSQGHYRLYFGLGKYQKADSVKIIWSDGQVQEINNLVGDQILFIEQNKNPKQLT